MLAASISWNTTALFRVRYGSHRRLTAVTDPDIASRRGDQMTDSADLDFRKAATGVSGDRTERRMKMVPAFMIAAIASIVVLALIVEARMTPEQRTVLFESSYAYP
jgi:hypothetical protein